jgi:uncharacterized membrane protein YqhA
MLRRVLVSSRYIVLIAVVGTFVGSVALFLYEAIVMLAVVFDVVREGSIAAKAGKVLAVGLIEVIDVFLIAIVAYIFCLSFYKLFVDETLLLPRWLVIHDLEDLENHLVSVVIAVLAVMFLREAVARAGDTDLLRLGAALAILIATLVFFLTMKKGRKE